MLFAKLTEVLDPEPHCAALNMAIDEVLLRRAADPLLRIYRWARPAISFGYFEKVSGVARPGCEWEMVRRWTGGGIVLHGEDVTYTLIVPAAHGFMARSARESYREIHECIAGTLRAAGVATSLVASAAAKVSADCFENPVEADLLAGSRKIAGAAQRRTRWGLLHQGSVQGVSLAGNFAAQLAVAFAAEVASRPLSGEEVAEAQLLAAEKYGSEAWLRRF